jgi:single-strand DNA-binding protein
MANITITITGNLGKPAQVRQLPSGKTITNLSVGHTPRIKQNGEWTDGETIWFSVSVWGSLPEILFTTGASIMATGTLIQRSYDKDGEKRQALQIDDAVVALTHRPARDGESSQPENTPARSIDEDDARKYRDFMPF